MAQHNPQHGAHDSKHSAGSPCTIYIRVCQRIIDQRNYIAAQTAQQIDDVCSLDAKLAAKMLPLAARIGEAMKKGLGCAGFNLVQNNGEAAGQTVFHFHIHIIPRYDGGPDIVSWTPGISSAEDLAETGEKIRNAM